MTEVRRHALLARRLAATLGDRFFVGGSVYYGNRQELLGYLARMIALVDVSHPVRVAIDGPPPPGSRRWQLGGHQSALPHMRRGMRDARMGFQHPLMPR